MSELFHVLTEQIKEMPLEAVMDELLNFHGRFKLDYTEEYLSGLPVEKVRHILLAAKLTQLEPPQKHASGSRTHT